MSLLQSLFSSKDYGVEGSEGSLAATMRRSLSFTGKQRKQLRQDHWQKDEADIGSTIEDLAMNAIR